MLFLLPWLDTGPVRSATYRPLFKKVFWVFLADCLLLGYIGAQPPEGKNVVIGQILTAWYFIHFLVILPWLSRCEKTLPLPDSISEAVAKKG
jgi:ubiquinol-cytochrome c reductase cytochrome b subunit